MIKIFLLAFICISAVCVSIAAPVRIVCMGNSITQGNINKTTNVINQMSYRFALWQKLDSAGIDIDMVGYTNLWFDEKSNKLVTPPVSIYTGHVFDREHDAYYGITSSGLLNGDPSTGWTGAALPSLALRLNSYTPDIALLHVGTNDADGIVTTTVANIKAIIDALRVKNPNVVVFVAKLITGWKPINAKVEQIVLDKSTTQSPVIAVDLATGFINDTKLAGCMTYDWVHPNPLGQEFMAKRWFAAIQKQLNLKTSLGNNIPSPTSIEIYPRISKGEFTIKNANNVLIQVFNASGVMLKNIERTEIGTIQLDLSDLNNGLYIVNINQNGKVNATKIIIKK